MTSSSVSGVPDYLMHVADKPLSPAYCQTLEGHRLAEFVFDRMQYKMAVASEGGQDGEAAVLQTLTRPLRTFYHFRVADAEIGNGGLWGYFGLGLYPKYQAETFEAFRALGLKKVVKLLEQTSAIHKVENRKYEAARADGRAEEFINEYEFSAYEAMEAKLAMIRWDFDRKTEKFLRKHLEELVE